jgi:hypothetical protein
MTDYRINGDVDGRTWFRVRYVLLEKQICYKEGVVGEIYLLRNSFFFFFHQSGEMYD